MKFAAERLAELLSDARGSKILGLIRLLRLLNRPGATTDSDLPSAATQAPSRVGIWTAESLGPQQRYVRDKHAADITLWADIESIPPKQGSLRTVLVGESVARGYLYDPCFTPALALQDLLRSACGTRQVDVVDLARSDLLIDGLQQILLESLLLEPDAIVVFAGNNWGAQIFDMLSPVIAKRLSEGADLAELSLLVTRHLGEMAACFIEWLGMFSKQAGIPVLVMVPEFNLVDWHPSVFPAAPCLPDSRNAQWFEIRRTAECALAEGDLNRAKEKARELRQLDGGITMAAAWLEAESARRAGDPVNARALLQTVRDAEIWRPVQSTPRCFSAIQDSLRSAVHAAGLDLLDLPERFEQHTGTLPDRRLFLDYCHLTSEGINVAMASVAELLLPHLGVEARTWRDLLQAAREPPPEVEGDARLLAAIHCAKLGHSLGFVRHHCQQAVAASPRAIDEIRCCLDFQARRSPNVLCGSFAELLQRGTPSLARYLLTHGCESKESHKALRRVFTDAALDVLDPLDPSIGVHIRALTDEIHGVTPAGSNLLDMAYSDEGICSESQAADFHRSLQVMSRFVVFCGAPTALDLRFTLRLPEGDGDVLLLLNERIIGSVRGTRLWTLFNIVVTAELTAQGRNELKFRWPVPANLGEGGLRRISESMELGVMPEMSPILGEIHSLTVCAGCVC